VQFRHEGFVDLVARVLKDANLPPELLELELTESLLLGHADLMIAVIQELRNMGVKMAIDDFGTGYSSLSYLRHYPVNKLKIDRSFIRFVDSNSDDAAIAAAIISMAKNLNLKVIAEGVETEEQLAFLCAHRCDEIQGYYFSKPLTADRIPEMLRKPASRVRAAAATAGKVGG
jgi:EAL domain-containing protein (putative c-di-GMP-specific phosphodiesterase class I)